MSGMNKITDFIQKERFYILILILILLFNLAMFFYAGHKAGTKKAKAVAGLNTREEREKRFNEITLSRKEMTQDALRKNERLVIIFGLVTLLVITVFLSGIVADIIISAAILRKRLDIRTLRAPEVRWTVWDVCKVIILFFFFGYMLVIQEAFWMRVLPFFKSEALRMIINTSILDSLAILFVIYFSVVRYKEDLKALGLSFKNFFKNIFYGIVGYIALVPVLVLILAATLIIINLIKYIPQKQPVVELLLREKGVAFLAYSSFFAAIFGPIAEELFFRAFMYGAFRKYIGVFWAMILTSALFAALHTHTVGFLPIMALGILLAYLYEKTGTLVSSITVHITHNLCMVFLVFLVKQTGAF